MKPWNELTAAERAAAYQDASLRIHDIDWYQFHGVDPRDEWAAEVAKGLHAYHGRHGCQDCANALWCAARKMCLRTVARVAA